MDKLMKLANGSLTDSVSPLRIGTSTAFDDSHLKVKSTGRKRLNPHRSVLRGGALISGGAEDEDEEDEDEEDDEEEDEEDDEEDDEEEDDEEDDGTEYESEDETYDGSDFLDNDLLKGNARPYYSQFPIIDFYNRAEEQPVIAQLFPKRTISSK